MVDPKAILHRTGRRPRNIRTADMCRAILPEGAQ